MQIRERFLRAIDHVEDNLSGPLRLDQVAAHAGLSPTYFSRLFRALTGQTFGGYVRRRRLSQAAERLERHGGEVELIDLAFECRYDSQEAFTRAFKRAFGVTPGAYRARPPLRHHRDTRIDATTLAHLTEVLNMKPVIDELDAFTVVGVRARFDPESKHQIPELWKRFAPLEAEVPHRRGQESYGVCLNVDSQEGSFDYLAGVEVERVDALPPGLVAETIPRQTYAVFRHTLASTDLHRELQPTLRWIWGSWLPGGPYDYVGGPDFERYPPDFDPTTGRGFLEICVPVSPRA